MSSLLCKYSTTAKQLFKDNYQRLLTLVTELDRQGLVVELKSSDIEKKYTAASSKGGQKANKTHNLVLLKHVPTGIRAEGRDSRMLPENHDIAMARLRMAVDIHLKGDESVFVRRQKEKQEQARKNSELRRYEAAKRKENDLKLKKLLLEEDTLHY
ncbi:unnamed protein product [Clavelina lepadiformis]|uniref:Prokaryotic-type class I peptide chain release factors domain-containing protein n=1 Tax=Clavelina lepadiformis TaxID=159417 RepID=A0ABP0EYY4_CLALP